jgi:hypothetical protein
MILKRILPDELAQKWAEVSLFIEDALLFADGDYTLDQVKLAVVNNQWLLIGIYEGDFIKGALTVSFMNMPNDRIGFVTTIGGKNIFTKDTYKQLKEILKQFGATKIQGGVRESVARLWRKVGFKERYILVENTI